MTKLVTTIIVIAVVAFGGWFGFSLAADDPKPADAADDQLKLIKLDMTQRELVQVEADIRKLTVELNFWNARADKIAKIPIPNSAIEERIGQDSMVTRRLADIARLREELVLARNKISAKNSTVLERLLTEIGAAEKDVDSLKQALRTQVTEQLRERAEDEFKGKLTQYQEQINLLTDLQNVLRKDIQTLTNETRKLRPANEQRLTQIENELRELKSVVAELRKGK